MAKLVFNAEDVRRVVEHSLANQQSRYIVAYRDGKPVYTVPTEPCVILVHDDGVYLMSNGTPRDIIKMREGDKPGDGTSYAAYARGCDPRKAEFDVWWETSRSLVGGDDFAEHLPWAEEIKKKIDAGAKEIVIWFTASQLRLA